MKLPLTQQEKLSLIGVLLLLTFLVFFGYRQARDRAKVEVELEPPLPDICEIAEETSIKAIGQEGLDGLRELLQPSLDLDEKSLVVSAPYDWSSEERKVMQVVAQTVFCYAYKANPTLDWTVRLRSPERRVLVTGSNGEKFHSRYETEWQPTGLWENF